MPPSVEALLAPARELGERGVLVGVDVERIVGLRGARKQMYEGLAVPLARATIDKGRILNSSESRAVMAEIRRNF